MKNVTITLDEATAQWVRHCAADRQVSVSRFIGDLMRDQMQHERKYEIAMRQFLSVEPQVLRAPGESYASREELHDRTRIR
jgi:hypothetical protein